MGNGVIWEMATRCTCLYNGKAQKKKCVFPIDPKILPPTLTFFMPVCIMVRAIL